MWLLILRNESNVWPQASRGQVNIIEQYSYNVYQWIEAGELAGH